MSRRVAALLTVSVFALGCGSDPAPVAGVVTGAAGGISIDVENIAPDRFDDAAAEPILVYPVKFVCGEAGAGSRHAPGSYRTVINVLNLSQFKVTVQWRFTNFQTAFPGASAELPSRGSMMMDCDFIQRQFAGSADLSDVLEGFVIIEDLNSTRMVRASAVYTALHKQLHDRPDLVPVRTAPHYCDTDDGELFVTVRNQGDVAAGPSTTRVQFEGSSPVDLATPALDPGEQVRLDGVELPDGEGRFPFTIEVDRGRVVPEVNELNNVARGACLLAE